MKKTRLEFNHSEWTSSNLTDSSNDSDDESDTGIYTTLSPVTPPSCCANDALSSHPHYQNNSMSRPPGTLIFMRPSESNSTQNSSNYARQSGTTQLNIHTLQQNFHPSSVAGSISLLPPSSQSHATPPNSIEFQSPPPPPQYPSPGQTASITTPSGGTTGDEQMTPSPLCGVSPPCPAASGFPVSVDPRQVPLLSHLLQPQPGSVTGEKFVNPMNTQIYLSESTPVPHHNLSTRPRMHTPTEPPAAPVPPHKKTSPPFNLPLGSSQQSGTASSTANGCVLATARPCTGTAISGQHLPPKSPALSRVNSMNQRGICRALSSNQGQVSQSYESQPSVSMSGEMNSQAPLHSNSTSTGSPQLKRTHITLPENPSSFTLQNSGNVQRPTPQAAPSVGSVSQSRSRSQPNLMKDYVNLDPGNLGLFSLHDPATDGHEMSAPPLCYPGASGLSAWNEMVMRENHALWMQLKQANSYQLDLIERRVRQLESVFDQLVDSHERQCQLDCQIVSQYEAEMARLALDNDRLRITINRLNLDTDSTSLRHAVNAGGVQTTPNMERTVSGRRSIVSHLMNQVNSSHCATSTVPTTSGTYSRLSTQPPNYNTQSTASNPSSSTEHWKIDRLCEELKHNLITDKSLFTTDNIMNDFVKGGGLINTTVSESKPNNNNHMLNMGSFINNPHLMYPNPNSSSINNCFQNHSLDQSSAYQVTASHHLQIPQSRRK